MKTKNYYFYLINNKASLKKTYVNIINITPDGNCFFRCISEFLFGTEEKYHLIRLSIYSYAKIYKKEIADFQPNVEI